MISIKYDFPPPTRARARSLVFLAGPLHLLRSFRTGFFTPSLSFLPLPAGVTQGLTHSLIISSQCTVRNSLVTRTRTHVHRGPASPDSPPPSPPSLPPLFHCSHSLTRSLVGGHRLLDFIEFSSSARRHPVQTRIRQLTLLACGGSAIKPTVREIRFTARLAFSDRNEDPECRAVKISPLISPNRFGPYITRSRFIASHLSFSFTSVGSRIAAKERELLTRVTDMIIL